jgi:hypothetical protein
MNKQEIEQLTNEELETIVTAYATRLSQLHRDQWVLREALGSDNEAVQILWANYLALDEEANPYRVVSGQRMMQAQRENMTEEEWRSIVD